MPALTCGCEVLNLCVCVYVCARARACVHGWVGACVRVCVCVSACACLTACHVCSALVARYSRAAETDATTPGTDSLNLHDTTGAIRIS